MQVAAARAAPRALGPVRPPASAGDSAYHNLISPIQLHGTAHPSGPPPGAAVAGGGDGEVVAGSAGPPRPTALRARQLPIYIDAASCAARGCRAGFSPDGLQPTTYNRTAPLTPTQYAVKQPCGTTDRRKQGYCSVTVVLRMFFGDRGSGRNMVPK